MNDDEWKRFRIGGRAGHPTFIRLDLVLDFLQATKVLRLEGRTASISRIEVNRDFLQIAVARMGSLKASEGALKGAFRARLNSAMSVRKRHAHHIGSGAFEARTAISAEPSIDLPMSSAGQESMTSNNE